MRILLLLILLFSVKLVVLAEPLDIVHYDSDKPAGTIIVNTDERLLYYLADYQLAYVYPIAVGQRKYQFFGKYKISKKTKWPTWRPTDNILEDKPWLPTVVKGGKNNPLGARALYLGDSVYRIHGTNNPDSIGKAASRGCIRMHNEDAIELYSMVDMGAEVYIQ